MTRIGNGKLEIQRDEVDLADIVRSAVGISQPDIEAKEQTSEVVMDPERMEMQGDSARLQQTVWNLVKNASKFTPRGGRIRVSAREVAGAYEIKVEDNGIGIAADALDSVFDPFCQETIEVTREFGGLGLGLAIAKATVNAHGGDIRAESAGRGEGAQFTVRLPRQLAAR